MTTTNHEGIESQPREWWQTMTDSSLSSVDLRTDQPHSARMYDYYLGGKDNFPADREAAEDALAVFPSARVMARENREFMARATRYLAGEVGVRQFLDIGTGIPTSPNLHEVAQGIAADTRVVYADNDPIVLTHARALLTSTPQGRTAYLDADLRDPERIMTAPELQSTLDLTEPVALSVIAILHFVPDDADPYGIVRRLLEALPSGSYLALTHATADLDPAAGQMAEKYREQGITAVERSHAQITSFFAGLELVDPGVQVAHRWRPDDPTAADLTDAQVSIYAGLGRKP